MSPSPAWMCLAVAASRQEFTDFKADVDHYVTQSLIDHGIRQRRDDAVLMPLKVKDRLRGHLHAMRSQIDEAEIPEAKRAALHKKLADFEAALEKDRLPIFVVARIIVEICRLLPMC